MPRRRTSGRCLTKHADMFFKYNPDTKETFNRTYQKLQYFPEVDPDRIGIAIFDVDGSGEKIKPNISRMTSGGEKPLRKYDRVHFVKSMEYPNGTKKEIRNSTEFTRKMNFFDEINYISHYPLIN